MNYNITKLNFFEFIFKQKSHLLPIISFIIAFSIFWAFGNFLYLNKFDTLIFKFNQNFDPTNEYLQRMILNVATSVLIIFMIYGLTISTHILSKNINKLTRKQQIIYRCKFWFISIAMIVITLIWLKPTLGKEIATQLFYKVNNSQDILLNPMYLAGIILFALAFFWAGIVTSASSLLFMGKIEQYPISKLDQLSYMLSQRIVQYKTLLYTTAVVFSVGVITTYLLYSWPESFLKTYLTITKTPIKDIVQVITAYWAITFFIFIVSVFLPVGFVQYQWKSYLVGIAHKQYKYNKEKSEKDSNRNNKELFDTKKWLEEQNLASSPRDIIQQLIAVFSPILTSVIGLF